jgi:hypothetical protein
VLLWVALGTAASIGEGGHGRQDYQGRQKSPATLHLHYIKRKKKEKKNVSLIFLKNKRARESSTKF